MLKANWKAALRRPRDKDGPQSRRDGWPFYTKIRCRNSERLSVTMDAAVAIPS